MKRKLVSILLVLAILMTSTPVAFAGSAAAGLPAGEATVDFDASSYTFDESQGTARIRVVRTGDTSGEVNIAYRVADFLSEYGTDYEILGENGKALAFIEGVKPSVEDLEVSEESYTFPDEVTEPEETALLQGEETESDKKVVSTGSALLDARNLYLGQEATLDTEAKADEIEDTVSSFYEYLADAQGASGVLAFSDGEAEKDIVIRLIDNDTTDGQRIFIVALVASSDSNVRLASGGTTYVSIIDDEPYNTPYVTLHTDQINLSKDSPKAELVLERTNGLQYFTTVYVSTVTETAKDGTYKEFTDEAVTFLPGETRKTFEVEAKAFEESATFGVRLESDGASEIGNHYVSVNITAIPLQSASPDALLMASSHPDGVSGVAKTTWMIKDIDWVVGGTKGSSSGKNDKRDTDATTGDYNLYIYEDTDQAGRTWVTSTKWNLTGINKIEYIDFVSNPDHSSYYDNFDTYFGISDNQEWGHTVVEISHHGPNDWTTRQLDVTRYNSSYYLKFFAKASNAGWSNVGAKLGHPLSFIWAKVTFDTQDSLTNINRKIYDFSRVTVDENGDYHPYEYYIPYDGETSTTYNPGKVEMTYADGTPATGFYGNGSEAILIRDANKELNASRDIHLTGVIFARGDFDYAAFRDYIQANGVEAAVKKDYVYYVPAYGETAVVYSNQTFLKELYNKNVIAASDEAPTVKVYPVYEQDTTTLRFENNDGRGYSERELHTHIDNAMEIVGYWNKTFRQGIGGFTLSGIPVGSVIHLSATPEEGRQMSDTIVVRDDDDWYARLTQKAGENYYIIHDRAAGTTNFSAKQDLVPAKEDKAACEFVLTGPMTAVPCTSPMTLYVSCYPGLENQLTDAMKECRIEITAGSADQVGKYAKLGKVLRLTDEEAPYIGEVITITGVCPEGYHIEWTHASGDLNHDGYRSEQEHQESMSWANDSKNEMYVWGNEISFTVDQYDTCYYYQIVPDQASYYNKTGLVVRQSNTLLNLASGKAATSIEPVKGAFVNVGGQFTETDESGRYSVPMKGINRGYAAVTIAPDGASSGGRTYTSTAQIESYDVLELPAFEYFTVKSVSGVYTTVKNGVSEDFISGTYVTTADGTFVITATVTDPAVKATEAEFKIVSGDGTQNYISKYAEGYETTFTQAGTAYTAKLTFNPKQDIVSNDKIYVRYKTNVPTSDGSDTYWTNWINVGYTFTTQVSLETFTFTLLGGETGGGIIASGIYDLIGNPLASMNLGEISAFDVDFSDTKTAPAYVGTDDEAKYTWPVQRYSFGFSYAPLLASKIKNTPDDKYKAAMKEWEEAAKTDPNVGAKPDKSSFKTSTYISFKYNVRIAFQMRLTNREVTLQNGTTTIQPFFEDLLFLVNFGATSKAGVEVALPIGFNILVEAGLGGQITGIYYMYNNYGDDQTLTERATKYDDDFSLYGNGDAMKYVEQTGYLGVDPYIYFKLGVGVLCVYVYGKANFSFDMDFQFTSAGVRSYGSMDIDLDWGVQVLSFEVYEKKNNMTTVKLFSSAYQEGHIDSPESYLMQAAADAFAVEDGEVSLTRQASRDYLNDRTAWMGNTADLMADRIAGETYESALLFGVPNYPETKLEAYGAAGENALIVFIDDSTADSRFGVLTDSEINNARQLYYSKYENGVWSDPALVDNDGTMDGYPSITKLADGNLMVIWSSEDADWVAENQEANLDSALQHLNLKASLFNATTGTFGPVSQITKTTGEDRCADVDAHPVIISDNELMVFYNKTEYKLNEDLVSFSAATSVIAYLYAKKENGEWVWQNKTDINEYSQQELAAYLSESNKSALSAVQASNFIANWYGQRFTETKVMDRAYVPLLVASDVIAFDVDEMRRNAGLEPRALASDAIDTVLGAWIIDWDRNLNTVYDRSILLEVFDVEQRKFTKVIQMTNETAHYENVTFATLDDDILLFFGTQKEGEDEGTINYYDVGEIFAHEMFSEVDEGGYIFWTLRYWKERKVERDDPNNPGYDTIQEYFSVDPAYAVTATNTSDFDVIVDPADGTTVYILWPGLQDDGTRQIMVSTYSRSGDAFTEPLALTTGNDIAGARAGYEGVNYSDISAYYHNGTLYAFATGVVEKQTFNGSQANGLMIVEHEPASKPVVYDIEQTGGSLAEGHLTFDVTLKNMGLVPVTVDTSKIHILFNGTELAKTFEDESVLLTGGAEAVTKVSVQTIPSLLDTEEAVLYVEGNNASDYLTRTWTKKANVTLVSGGFYENADGLLTRETGFKGRLMNEGAKAAQNVNVTVYVLDKEGERVAIDAIPAGAIGVEETALIDAKLTVPDEYFFIQKYDADKDVYAAGVAQLVATVTTDGEEAELCTMTLTRLYDAQAVSALNAITIDGAELQLETNKTEQDLQPVITGSGAEQVHVVWETSSDESVLSVNGYNNTVDTKAAGTVILTGKAVPARNVTLFSADGTAYKTSWNERIPDYIDNTVTTTVVVSEKNEPNPPVNPPVKPPVKPVEEEKKTTDNIVLKKVKDYVKGFFDDVKETNWFYDDVVWVYEHGLMEGEGNLFSPNADTTRAQVVTILYRLVGEPEVKSENTFTDVKAGSYYEKAVTWARENGIVEGRTPEIFDPKSPIARQDIAVILRNFAKYEGIDVSAQKDLGKFTDANQTSKYAEDPLEWAYATGLLEGVTDTTMEPRSNTPRKQIATILRRFCEKIMELKDN